MTPQVLTMLVILLALVICAALVALILDARQRRMDRQVEALLAIPLPPGGTSIRRTRVGEKGWLLNRLINYKSGISYFIRPAYVLLAGAAAAAAVFQANRILNFSLFYVSGVAGLVALLMVRGLFGWQRHRLANQLFRQLPDAIEMVTSAVRAGLPVGEAFRSIARDMPQPTSGQFAQVCNELKLGRPAEAAMEDVFHRTGVTEYSFFAVTLAVQMKAGGNLCETLQTLANTVRQRVGMADRAKALAAEVIFSSRALSAAPVIVTVIYYLINPRLVDLLFTDPTGQRLLAFAAASTLMGTLVINWIVKRNTTI